MGYENRPTMLVILGAGASFDCLPSKFRDDQLVEAKGLPPRRYEDVRPPLTQNLAEPGDLRNALLSEWFQAQPVINYLRRRLLGSGPADSLGRAITLERALSDYDSTKEGVPEVEEHMFAMRFYLRDLLWQSSIYMESASLTGGITNYHELLSRVLNWCAASNGCACFVSFNYDLLLESAMRSSWNFDPSKMESYLAHDRVHLLKPHGSVQWYYETQSKGRLGGPPYWFGRQSVKTALESGIDTSQILCDDTPAHANTRIQSAPRIPAMALPVDGKADLVWPDEQSNRIQELQGSVARVVTIGWRAIENHFLPLLRPIVRQDARVAVVTGGRDGVVEAEKAGANLVRHLDLHQRDWESESRGLTKALDSSDVLSWVFEPAK